MTPVFHNVQEKNDFLHMLRAHLAAQALAPGSSLRPALVDLSLVSLVHYLTIDLVFHESIPVGADLTQVIDHWFLWLLEAELGEYKASAPVAALYRRRLEGDEPPEEKWKFAAVVANAHSAGADHPAVRAASEAVVEAVEAATAPGKAFVTFAAIAAVVTAGSGATFAAAAARQACRERMREALLGFVRDAPIAESRKEVR
jgi:hypothetical protein